LPELFYINTALPEHLVTVKKTRASAKPFVTYEISDSRNFAQ